MVSRRTASPSPSFQSEVDSAIVTGQEDRLGAVFGHVLQNALDATPADGRVVILLRSVGDQAVVEIRDTGSGITKENLDKIFDPFFTTNETGTGLGLAITHGIIEQHGGKIMVESTPGKGSLFTIILPVNREENNAV